MRLVRPVHAPMPAPTISHGAWLRRRFSWLAPLLLLAVIAVQRWSQQGSLPTGVDGGQWLALGRGLFGPGRSTDGAYPPLVPFVVHVTALVFGPLDAVRGIAVGSLIAIPMVFYVIARPGLGPVIGLAMTAALATASTIVEPSTFGGYPQQVGIALLILASWASAHFLAGGAWRWWVAAAVVLLLAALTHHIYFPLALSGTGVVWLIWLTTRPPRRTLIRRSLAVFGAWLAGLIASLPTLLAFREAAYAPPLRASGFSVTEAFRYGTREATWLWLLVIGFAVATLTVTVRLRHKPTWQIATSLLGLPSLLFVVSGEVRLLPPLLAGGLLGLGFGLHWLNERVRDSGWTVAPHLAACTVPLLLWSAADAQAADYYRYYRVVDTALVSAVEGVAAEDPRGGVAVRANQRGWPVGWWFEGLTEERIVVGADERWLGFPTEREQARIAARFFAPRLTSEGLRELSARENVDLLVFAKWEWIGWQRWLDEPDPAVRVVFDDDRFMVLEILWRRAPRSS